MKTIVLAALLAAAVPGCDAYHRHPVATVAASAGLIVGPAEMVIGCGFIDNDTPNWQDTAEHRYGIAYIGLATTVLAAAVFAALYPE